MVSCLVLLALVGVINAVAQNSAPPAAQTSPPQASPAPSTSAPEAPATAVPAPTSAPAAVTTPRQNSGGDLVRLESSETVFTVLAAINNCGYDAGLANSDPLRIAIRGEIGHAVELSDDAKSSADAFCAFYRDHQQPDAVQTLSQYISLALYMTSPPALTLKVKDADLPPDASGLLGAVPLLQKFYKDAGFHEIWQKHSADYAQVTARYRDALAKMISGTELYLRVPTGGYLGRGFDILVQPMGAPSEVNARNYGSDYYVVVTPGASAGLKMELIRHTYLHYLIDPMIGKYATNLTALEPVLEAVKLAPMDESFKADASLLTTECVIRAIEARRALNGNSTPEQQEEVVQQSMAQGFVLTQYFYDKLLDFERDNAGFRNDLPAMLTQIDIRKEAKRASQVQFAESAQPELLQLQRPHENKLLAMAQERLSAGDTAAAEKLAKQALAEKTEDPGCALFILAQIALRGNIDGAKDYFEQALKSTNDPTIVAWSHIYLGRIFDLQDEDDNGPDRVQAISHYKAAIGASDELPEAKAAAQQGLQKPYAHARQSGDAQPQKNNDKN